MSPWFWILPLIVMVPAAGLLGCYLWISRRADPYILNNTDALPFRRTALLLGTAKRTGQGGLNPFFANRITKAAQVYHTQKVSQVLISGADQPARRPDEVDEMFQALQLLGVPSRGLLQDHGGTRTLVSLQRCKQNFATVDPLIISQRFHNQRAVFIALRLGMQPIAINATPVKGRAGTRMILREALARVKCLMDCYCGPWFAVQREERAASKE